MPHRLVQVVVAVVAATLTLAACGSNSGGGAADGKLSVVASTDVYGAVASAIAGDHATVTSLFSNPTGDPHEFEPSAQDTLAVKRASVIVFNGGHYDQYIETAADGADGAKIDATTLQEPKGENEHVFYDLPTMGKVAIAVATALGERDAAHRDEYLSKAAEFNTRLSAVITKARDVGRAHPGAKVAATEPVASYLLTLTGLTDATPPRYTAAIESGTDPAPADIAAATALLTDRQVRAVVINSQTESPVTKAFADTAAAQSIPVVRLTESLPASVTDYVSWQESNVASLAAALTPRP